MTSVKLLDKGVNKRNFLKIINLYRGCKPWQYCPNWQRRFWPSPCPTYGSKWSYSQYWIKKPSKKQVCITFKSTVIRKVSRYFITVFRYIAKSICTTYQGLLQATSILTLWQKLSPRAHFVVLGLKSVIWSLWTCLFMTEKSFGIRLQLVHYFDQLNWNQIR